MSWQRLPKYCSISRVSKRKDGPRTIVCIYLSVWGDRRSGDDMLKVFASTESWQEKINCENKRAVPLMGASDGIRSSHVCAALRCPHLRQTHVVLISCIWTHSFTLRLHLFLPPKAPLVSLHSSHQSRLCCCSCCSDSHLPFFHNTSFPFTFLISFANIFSASFHLFSPSSSF